MQIDRPAEVIEAEQETDAGRDLVVGRVRKRPSDGSVREQSLDPLEDRRQGLQVRSDRFIRRAVDAPFDRDDRSGSPDCQPERYAEGSADCEGSKSAAVP